MNSDGKIDLPESNSIIVKFCNAVVRTVEAPGDWIRHNIVRPNQTDYPYYHQKFRRVPTVDQCYEDDLVCIFEADQQFRRDKDVDSAILSILRQRFEACILYEGHDNAKCLPLQETYKDMELNYFTKYGDLGVIGKSQACYMRQKHRMIWERRHGPIGSGIKESGKTCVEE